MNNSLNNSIDYSKYTILQPTIKDIQNINILKQITDDLIKELSYTTDKFKNLNKVYSKVLELNKKNLGYIERYNLNCIIKLICLIYLKNNNSQTKHEFNTLLFGVNLNGICYKAEDLIGIYYKNKLGNSYQYNASIFKNTHTYDCVLQSKNNNKILFLQVKTHKNINKEMRNKIVYEFKHTEISNLTLITLRDVEKHFKYHKNIKTNTFANIFLDLLENVNTFKYLETFKCIQEISSQFILLNQEGEQYPF